MPYAFLPGVDLLNHGGVDANCELSAVKLAPGGNEENDGATSRLHASRIPPRANSSRYPTATSRITAGCCACTGSPRAGTFTTDERSSFGSPATRWTRGGRPGDGARGSTPRVERYFGSTGRGSPPSLSTSTPARVWTIGRLGDRILAAPRCFATRPCPARRRSTTTRRRRRRSRRGEGPREKKARERTRCGGVASSRTPPSRFRPSLEPRTRPPPPRTPHPTPPPCSPPRTASRHPCSSRRFECTC